jgi:hypothetical protein
VQTNGEEGSIVSAEPGIYGGGLTGGCGVFPLSFLNGSVEVTWTDPSVLPFCAQPATTNDNPASANANSFMRMPATPLRQF